jgi:thiamine pyrophosphate-dependent acetolactate synthase large subunit-like protein
VCSGYQHNDSFPGSHPLAAGPLGYNGSKAGMELIKQADVVLALGTRLKSIFYITWLWNGLLAKRCKYYSSGYEF